MFDCLSEFSLTHADVDIRHVICTHLSNLRRWFEEYFPPAEDRREEYNWVRNPFDVDIAGVILNGPNQDKLIELTSDGALKGYFQRNGITIFLIHAHNEFPEYSRI